MPRKGKRTKPRRRPRRDEDDDQEFGHDDESYEYMGPDIAQDGGLPRSSRIAAQRALAPSASRYPSPSTSGSDRASFTAARTPSPSGLRIPSPSPAQSASSSSPAQERDLSSPSEPQGTPSRPLSSPSLPAPAIGNVPLVALYLLGHTQVVLDHGSPLAAHTICDCPGDPVWQGQPCPLFTSAEAGTESSLDTRPAARSLAWTPRRRRSLAEASAMILLDADLSKHGQGQKVHPRRPASAHGIYRARPGKHVTDNGRKRSPTSISVFAPPIVHPTGQTVKVARQAPDTPATQNREPVSRPGKGTPVAPPEHEGIKHQQTGPTHDDAAHPESARLPSLQTPAADLAPPTRSANQTAHPQKDTSNGTDKPPKKARPPRSPKPGRGRGRGPPKDTTSAAPDTAAAVTTKTTTSRAPKPTKPAKTKGSATDHNARATVPSSSDSEASQYFIRKDASRPNARKRQLLKTNVIPLELNGMSEEASL